MDTLTITRTEWNKKHRDYKYIGKGAPVDTLVKGQRYMLKWIDGQGTGLVPVTVVKDDHEQTA